MAPVPVAEDLYMVLEVDQTATAEAITRAYKRLALKHHPDRNTGRDTTAAFQLLGKAYETLKDESKRRAYDLLYPSIRRSHTSPQTPCPPPTSGPQSGISSEAIQITKLEKSKQDRRARWWTRKNIFESSIFELQRDIRRLEQEIKSLESITAAEAVEESWKNSWSAWLLSPIYKKAQVSEEENARKERQKQERRIEKDMKERRLYSKRADLKKQETLLKSGRAEVDGADRADDWNISSLQATIRDREARAREARERARREEAAAAWKRQQEKWQREAAEELRRQQAAEDAAARRRQEEQDRARPGAFFDDGEPYFSAAGACAHDVWWPKIQGRRPCPRCYETWTYLLECPGCKIRACPRCQSTIRPRRNRRW